jgi:TPR repeat protein
MCAVRFAEGIPFSHAWSLPELGAGENGMKASSKRASASIACLLTAVALTGMTAGATAAEGVPTLRQQAYVAFDGKDYALALVLFERAAAAGDLLAAERAGEMLLEGQPAGGAGVPEDLGRASTLLRRAACAGSASAAALLDDLRRKVEALACGNQ